VNEVARPPALLRETLCAHVIEVLEAGSGRDPVVSLVRDGDRLLVLKDYASRAWWVREIVGRILNLPTGFVAALDAAVREMHRRGVAHLDLRHRTNILMDEAGCPVLIDFASAVCFRPNGLGARWLLPLFAWVDRRAVRKWAERLMPAA
jgi:serine/threonine protein kinase